MSFRFVSILVDTFSYQRTSYVGEFLVIDGEMLLLKHIPANTPRSHRTIRRFIKGACKTAEEMKIDVEINPSVTNLLNIRIVKKGKTREGRKEDAQASCL